jgi:hypothetical protein
LGNSTVVDAGSDFVEAIGPAAWRLSWEAAFDANDRTPSMGSSTSMRVELEDGFSSWVDPTKLDQRDGATEVTIRAPRPGRVSGEVLRADDGSPVAGTSVMINRWSVVRPHRVTTTDASGRFVFESIAPGDSHDLAVDSELWSGAIDGVEVRSGTTTELILRVEPPPRIRGRITIDGHPPGEPVVLGLGEFQDHLVVDGGWFGLGVSDLEGRYSVIPKYDRRFTVVPKRRTKPQDGGYRRFRSEFPKTHPESWPWLVQAPSVGETTLDLDIRD